MKSQTIKFLGFYAIAGMFLLSGCASSGACIVDYTSGVKATNADNLLIEVTCQDPQAEQEKLKIENALVWKLGELSAFKNIYLSSPTSLQPADIKLNVIITRIKRISKSTRFWLGSTAGRGRITADIEVFDLLANRKIIQAKVEGVTSSGTVMSGTTEEAINELAKSISSFLKENILQGVAAQGENAVPEISSPGKITGPAIGN